MEAPRPLIQMAPPYELEQPLLCPLCAHRVCHQARKTQNRIGNRMKPIVQQASANSVIPYLPFGSVVRISVLRSLEAIFPRARARTALFGAVLARVRLGGDQFRRACFDLGAALRRRRVYNVLKSPLVAHLVNSPLTTLSSSSRVTYTPVFCTGTVFKSAGQSSPSVSR